MQTNKKDEFKVKKLSEWTETGSVYVFVVRITDMPDDVAALPAHTDSLDIFMNRFTKYVEDCGINHGQFSSIYMGEPAENIVKVTFTDRESMVLFKLCCVKNE